MSNSDLLFVFTPRGVISRKNFHVGDPPPPFCLVAPRTFTGLFTKRAVNFKFFRPGVESPMDFRVPSGRVPLSDGSGLFLNVVQEESVVVTNSIFDGPFCTRS